MVVGAIDHAHAAGADLRAELVVAEAAAGQIVRGIEQRVPPGGYVIASAASDASGVERNPSASASRSSSDSASRLKVSSPLQA